MAGGRGSSSSGTPAPPPPKERKEKKQKSMADLVEATVKKTTLKIAEADGLGAALRRSGMYSSCKTRCSSQSFTMGARTTYFYSIEGGGITPRLRGV